MKKISPKNPRNYTIDFLKLFFMFMIVGVHSETIFGSRIYFLSGSLAVEFFFLVSGYLMAKSANERIEKADKLKEKLDIGKETIKYMLNKYSRIFLPLLVSIIICTIIRFYFYDKNIIDNAIYSTWELLCGQMYGFSGYFSTGVEWYLSAMFAALWILYPIYLKKRKTFSYIIAPLLTLFVLGWISHTYGNLTDAPGTWSGFFYKGMLRGIAEIAAGVICYEIANKVTKIKWTKFGHIILTSIEILCYALSSLYMIFHTPGGQDTIILLLLMIAVTITFSNQSITSKIFTNPKWSYCATFSGVLLFCHYTWGLIMKNKMIYRTPKERALTYVALSVATTIFVLIIIKIVQVVAKKLKGKIKLTYQDNK